MPSLTALWLFGLASLALLVVPGPSVIYIVTQGVAHGRRGGIVGMLGVQAGGVTHVLAAAVGLSAVLASSATAFSIVKYAGAGYLVYLGARRLLDRDASVGAAHPGRSRSLGSVFRQGFVVNLLNPKTALFFLAFLPQFVDPDRGHAWAQTLLLGGVFIALAIVSDGAWALAAGWVSSRLRTRATMTAERYGTGGVLIGLGIAAALAEPAKR